MKMKFNFYAYLGTQNLTQTTSYLLTFTCLCTLLISNSAVAEEQKNWYLKPNIGLSNLSELRTTVIDVAGSSGISDIDLDSGLVAGLALGYRYNDSLSVEAAWEYRSNDSNVTLPNNTVFTKGNYASNIFQLNGIYRFGNVERWYPYVGAGISLVQEIDIDLESEGGELSYSASGDTGFQVFGGVAYKFSDTWELQAELRYGSISGIDLESEEETIGAFNDLSYKPTTLQLGLLYAF